MSAKKTKPEIVIGKTYRNRGAGRTRRKVLAIGNEHRPKKFHSPNVPPREPGVLFEQNGTLGKLYLTSFTAWVGSVVEDNVA